MSTVYSMKDTNAPQAPAYSVSSYYGMKYFRSILVACLVDGYTGKSAAGWSVVYDDIDDETAMRFALANANGDVIEFVGVGSYGYAVFLWSNITTSGTGLTMSSGSGKAKIYGYTAPDLSDGNCAGINTYYLSQHSHSSNSNRSSWVLIADEYTFCFMPIYDAYNGTGSLLSKNISMIYCGAVTTPWRGYGQAGNFHLLCPLSNISSLTNGPSVNNYPYMYDTLNHSALETAGGSPFNSSNHEYYGNYMEFTDSWTNSTLDVTQENVFSFYPMQPLFLLYSGTDSNCPGFAGEQSVNIYNAELYAKYRFIYTAGDSNDGLVSDWMFNSLGHTMWADPMDLREDGYLWFWQRFAAINSVPLFGITNHPDYD
ncbi:hypothetical protein [Gynuella sp.]|uniref:hypothetical protein n=1 Tax=Gynuella sp. TaxID=2969146 RepID=UPI003D0E2087